MNTNQLMSDLSAVAMTQAIVENLYSVFVDHISRIPSAEIFTVHGTAGYFSGIPFPLFNGAVRPRFSQDTVDEAIDLFIAHARSRQVPMHWHVTPGSEPDDIGEHLEAHGFTRGEKAPGMAVELAGLPAETLPSGLSIERVRTRESIDHFSHVLCEASALPSWLEAPFVQMLTAPGFDDDSSIVNYAARLGGELVAVSSVIYGAGVAGIYNVGTLEAYRGRGIGRAVTLAPLLDARERGYHIGILHSSEQGLPVYRRLGFEQYCEIESYLWLSDPS